MISAMSSVGANGCAGMNPVGFRTTPCMSSIWRARGICRAASAECSDSEKTSAGTKKSRGEYGRVVARLSLKTKDFGLQPIKNGIWGQISKSSWLATVGRQHAHCRRESFFLENRREMKNGW
jgi:hypothetical protein